MTDFVLNDQMRDDAAECISSFHIYISHFSFLIPHLKENCR